MSSLEFDWLTDLSLGLIIVMITSTSLPGRHTINQPSQGGLGWG